MDNQATAPPSLIIGGHTPPLTLLNTIIMTNKTTVIPQMSRIDIMDSLDEAIYNLRLYEAIGCDELKVSCIQEINAYLALLG